MSGPIAVTGAKGMLGTELCRVAADRGVDLLAWDLDDFDLTDRESVRSVLLSERPGILIHAGAWTDVDGCESDAEQAFLVNARGTAHLVEAIRETGSRLIFVSTDYVFSGSKDGPYVEDDTPGPVSVYGWSKLFGEEAVRSLGPSGVVARTAWLYAEHGRNFLRTMLRLGRERSEISVVNDQVGSPTYAGDLARVLLDLAQTSASGIFHTTNTGQVSWNGFARKIFELVGLPTKVKTISSAEFPRPAKRPANSVLRDARLLEEGVSPPPSWEDGLQRCLERIS
jgi:dTDP-4-dehydrorhamnose reductase